MNNSDETEFSLSDIGVDLSDSKLTADQKDRAAEVFQKWQNIFCRGPTDLGHTDLVRNETFDKISLPNVLSNSFTHEYNTLYR